MNVSTDLSLVVALYFEEECVEEFVRRVNEALSQETITYEFVFVDDGSEDRTVEIVTGLAGTHPNVKLIQLSRNYGKEVAVTAGIEHAAGKYIMMMDVDLQDPPDRIMDFYRKIEEGYDLVFGVRIERSDSFTNKVLSGLFWWFLNGLTGLKIPTGVAVMRIFNQQFAQEFLRYPERVRFIEGIFMSVGLRRTTLPVENNPRFAGSSKFNLRRRLKLAVSAILAFSNRPVELATGFGMSLLGLSAIAGLWLVVQKVFFGVGLLGWTSTIVFVLFMGSVQIILLGIIGTYVGRIYQEVKARPIYTTQKRVNCEEYQDE